MTTRRNFLKTTAGVAAGGCLACLGCANSDRDTRPAPDITNGVMTLPLSIYDSLVEVGGVARFTVNTSSGFDRIIVVRVDQQTFVCVSRICTHADCDVFFDGTSQFFCPCHGSAFTTSGRVVQGPADLPLNAFQTSFDGSQVTVQLG